MNWQAFGLYVLFAVAIVGITVISGVVYMGITGQWKDHQ